MKMIAAERNPMKILRRESILFARDDRKKRMK